MQKPGKSWANWHKLAIQAPSGNLRFMQSSRRLTVKQPRLTQEAGVLSPAGHAETCTAAAGTPPNPPHAHKPSMSFHKPLRHSPKTSQPQVPGSQHLQQPSSLAVRRLTAQLPHSLGGQLRAVLHSSTQGAAKLATVTCPPPPGIQHGLLPRLPSLLPSVFPRITSVALTSLSSGPMTRGARA